MADEPEVSEAELADMISYYDRWKRDVLQRDLKKQLDEAAKQKEVLASWDKLEADVGQLLQSQQPPQYEAHVELGGGVSAVAEVPDCSTIYVAVGLGFHVECRLHEVARIVALQRGPLQQRLADLRANTAPLQEQIEYAEVTLESLRGTLPP